MNLTQKSINYIQAISSEIVMKANSGHTGVALGAATILFALFKDHLKFDVTGENINRDRFILSAGHASALYYTLLYTFGFDITIEDLENFRQIGSRTPGHPEYKSLKAIESTTGPLGQGVANAVGLAIAAAHYSKVFNVQKFQIFDNKVYCFVGDGDLMEGVAQESISLAGHLKLKNLIFLYDYNKSTIDGKLTKSNSEDVGKKFASQGYRVVYVSEGNNYRAVTRGIEKAKKEKNKPTIVIFRTKIGFQSRRQDDHTIHGTALTEEEFLDLKEKLGITTSMFIPNAVLKFCRQSTQKNNERYEEWKKNLFLYQTTHPELHKIFMAYPNEPKIQKDKFYKMFAGIENISGRDANKKIFNEITSKIVNIIGGSADLASSTKVYIDKGKDMLSDSYDGRNIFYGIREHAMAGISNGIALFENNRTFNSTFLAFSQYMLPSIRLSAMMKLPVWYYFTHDSIYIGQDGPTHQPIEQLGQLRLIPNLTIFRPADYIELIDCYSYALSNKNPCVFVLSRQDLPVVAQGKQGQSLKGAYCLSAMPKPQVSFMATGSEVAMALEAQKMLSKEGISSEVISVPSTTLFEQEKQAYKSSLLKNSDCLIAVEASNDNYWYRYTNNVFLLDRFGESGKGVDVAKAMGFTSKKLADYAKSLIKK